LAIGLAVRACWALAELVEAAARSSDRGTAVGALARLTGMTSAAGTDWALGIEARCRALLSEGEAADRLYRESVERLARTRLRPDLARARLLYGEWLRRERRRIEAREQLRTAHGMLKAMGAEAFAERARGELQATGETARRRPAAAGIGELTAHEAQIARLARDGLANPEIGARLFLSARTVQYHLGNVFAKLGISSRSQLDRVLPGELTPEPGRP
jgi:DNA-binding CsgD family transcriptional regulator